jgi:hypothetical protein
MIERMFVELLQELRRSVRTLAPETLTGPQAVALLEQFSEVKRLATAAETLLAARVAETNAWNSDGDRSPEEWLARRTGSSWGNAKSTLETAERVKKLPATEQAMRAGKLTAAQAAVITQAATADPDAEQELLDAAPQESLRELEKRGERIISAKRSREDDAEREKTIRRNRSLRVVDCSDGAQELRAKGNRADIAVFMGRLQPFIDEQFAKARDEDRREPRQAYAFDALLAMSESGGSSKSPAKVIVRVDLPAMVRGTTEPGEICEIAGYGPIPVTEAKRLLPGAFLALVLTKGKQVVNVTHLGRKFTEFQTTALEWTGPECTVLGCTASVRLEKDHRSDWAATKVTRADDADRFCHHHHDLKTRFGFQLEPGTGKRRLLPPERAPAAMAS